MSRPSLLVAAVSLIGARAGWWPPSACGPKVLALAGDQVSIIDIGDNVAYPGFIYAHAHWIGAC